MSHINFTNNALNTTVATLLNSTQSISSNSTLNVTVAGHLNATKPISSTVATLLNSTQPILHIQNSTLHTPFGNSSWIPLNNTIDNNNSSIYGGYPWYYNNSGYWNYTIFCPTCYPSVVTIDPPVVTLAYHQGIGRRAAAQRRRARQQSAAPYTATNNDSNTNNNGDDMTPKDFDLPPAYDDVVQSYMMAKQEQEQQQQIQESNVSEGATGGIRANPSSNNISTAVSTITIETEISNSNHVSIVDLDQASIPNPTSSQQPPSYDHNSEMSAANSKNDHIV
ncbi:hypothetical protein DOY81_011641 [Sarcophaga bullata]|nr:hypothetical protein DOY81_011641 [Sarcophaga bullata]